MNVGTIIQYTVKTSGQPDQPSKRYIGQVHSLSAHSHTLNESKVYLKHFELLADYLGTASGTGRDDIDIILHSPDENGDHHNAGNRPYTKCLTIQDFEEVHVCEHQEIHYTNQPCSVIPSSYMCRWVLMKGKGSEGRIETYLVPPSLALIPSGLQREPQPKPDLTDLTIADFFSRGGSKTQGFKSAEFDSVYSVDNAVDAHATYTVCMFPYLKCFLLIKDVDS